MILDIFFFQFLSIVAGELLLSDRMFDYDRGLERYERWAGSNVFGERAPSCDQRHSTEATPYVVIILSKTSGNFLCMGSILGAYHVLTVRECLLRDDMGDLLVLAGYVSPWWGRGAQVKHVAEIVKSDEDLAILKLRKRFRFTRQVKPIRLPIKPISSPHDSYGLKYGMIGFTRAPWDVPGEPMPKSSYYEFKMGTLMSGNDKEKCSTIYADVAFNETSMFCTFANVSYCWGNLGSPTVVQIDEQMVQMGIVVRAYCLDEPIPNLHLRIDGYEGWIRSNADAKSQI